MTWELFTTVSLFISGASVITSLYALAVSRRLLVEVARL